MSSVENIPVSIPEMETLCEKKEAAVTTLLQKVLSQYGNVYPPQFMKCKNEEDRRILAYKYLKARNWKVSDSMEMIKENMTFRALHNADYMNLFPCVFTLRGFDEEDLCRTIQDPYTEKQRWTELCYLATAPYYSAGYHYWDKEGHPVLYDFCGRSDLKGLFKSIGAITPVGDQAKDTILRYHLYMNLVQERLVKYADAKSVEKGGRRILGVTAVLNAEGLSWGMINSQSLDVLRETVTMDQKYFPEALHRLIVINCPSFVAHAYSLIRGSLDKNTQQKIIFCDKAYSMELLKKIVDEDKIPVFLGGSCSCSGGCLPGIDSECRSLADAPFPVPRTEYVSIAAGKRHTIELLLQPDEEAQWEFRCTKSWGGQATEIVFRAVFASQNDVGTMDSLWSSPAVGSQRTSGSLYGSLEVSSSHRELKSEKMEMDRDRFVTKVCGTLKLEWDNHSSWLQTKYLQLRVIKS
ncbi:hypothetical protein TCDM_04453 [Trypanosoma cruzi Dm28c]|uniref:CRAL-TRIO domain-containing protein n=2 Tax=Trypanosoma cruzi TaxID=5693 RepID=V5BL84_TRYCR|nr:hypothetical protein TCDM_04453 [Trypanosoma cruzi Dm28c]KAF8279331.1 hypothetical protein TcBrA4_0104130 [Trypanosoma cruzi]PBJ70466.1 hypothetical protein BCY84_18386 [Trypanosoma cruzi cruzi]PWU96996.1 hypothetical protein C4B63_17g118 [Trypanosoma cruzi]